MSNPISPEALSELIGSIYDCTLDPGHWDRTLCDLRDAFDADNASLVLLDRRGGQFSIVKNIGYKPEQVEERARRAPEINARMAETVAQRSSLDEPYVLSRHLPPGDWETSPYFQVVRKGGTIDILQYFLIWAADHTSFFSAGRAERQGVITEREITLGGLLLPHLRRAVTISKVLDARTIEHARMAEALDALKCGVALTKQNAAILHANRAAERMLRHAGPIQSVRGVLQATAPEAAKELRSAIRLAAQDEAALGKTGLAVRLDEGDEPPLFAHVLPLTHGELRTRLEPEAVAAVFISGGSDEAAGADEMAAFYGLTPAETRLLECLLAGRNLAETAAVLGIAMTTAKTHLDNVFQKTGVNRQAELMRLAARAASPARPRTPDLSGPH
jgi:DNA-binding CsgD family transcriptional regulator/PAS domain-containing protein